MWCREGRMPCKDGGKQLQGNRAPLRGASRGAYIMVPGLTCAALLFLALLPGCSSSTPQNAVREFLAARMGGEAERAASLTVERDLTGYLGGEDQFSSSDFTVEVELTELKNDRAVVTARFIRGDEEVSVPYACRYVGGRWQVALRETERLWWPDIQLLEKADKE